MQVIHGVLRVGGTATRCSDVDDEDTPLLVPQQLNYQHDDENDDNQRRYASNNKPLSVLLRRHTTLLSSTLIKPFTDSRGSYENIKSGTLIIFVVGSFIGIFMPKNNELPSTWYRYISSAIGYTYFIAWSISFYPQIITNHKLKSTKGLSNDFTIINHVGYICYTLYTTSMFFNSTIQEQFYKRHGGGQDEENAEEITVQSNDVAFAIHALILSFVWILQTHLYGGFERKHLLGLSKPIRYLLFGILATCNICAICILFNVNLIDSTDQLEWLDLIYLLSYIKVIISISKYIPQVILNYKRKTTVGYTVWNVILDLIGGTLSLLQLVFDCLDMQQQQNDTANFISCIAGNFAKFGLAFVSIFFSVSIVQN